MSRLLFTTTIITKQSGLLFKYATNRTNNKILYNCLSGSSILLPKSTSSLTSSLSNQQFRQLASHGASPAKVAATQSEPLQWERDDRFKIFYGFNDKDEADDKGTAHFFTFIGLFGFLFLPFFLIYYYPDYKTNEWCFREAHLELARREKAGEPLVSPDYVPVESIKLPSEEELGDTEIVI